MLQLARFGTSTPANDTRYMCQDQGDHETYIERKSHSFHPPKWGAPNPRPRQWHPVEVPPRSKWQRYPSLHHQFDRNHQRNSRSLRTTSCHYPSLHSILLHHHHHHHRCRSIHPSRWMTLRPTIRSFNKSWWVLRPYLTSTW